MNMFRSLAFLLVLVCSGAWAEGYPNKLVRIVVPFPAGGTTDIVARIVAQKMTEAWGQSVIVENRNGAGGNIGGEAVATAAPDGTAWARIARFVVPDHPRGERPFRPQKVARIPRRHGLRAAHRLCMPALAARLHGELVGDP